MHFISTRGETPPTSLREALFRGLAPDGGLYMPERLPSLGRPDLEGLAETPWSELANEILLALLKGAIPPEELEPITADSLDFPAPVVQVGERVHVLELFHGPTLAFKDVGARFMAGLLGHFRQEDDPPTTVLTATSGDTGGAVADALHGVHGVQVVVLFPDGKVTPRQERQFSTLGGNVQAVAVQGDFDDCQRLAKEAFESHARSRAGRPRDSSPPALTSANSINVGRFLPQTTYFFKAWQHFSGKDPFRTKIFVSVPSGNFGNLAAGLLAKRIGLPGVDFLAATNLNDVVPEFLKTGVYRPRSSTPTLSTAMDVGHPSNLDRILHLYGDKGGLGALQKDLVGQRVTDVETGSCIERVFKETGYILDPHTAVGMVALERALESRPNVTGLVLATAHPAKFAEVVEPVIQRTIPIPPELSGRLEAERQVIKMEPRLEALKEILRP
jgi:threonine synthase